MKPQEALDLLDRGSSTILADRQTHSQIQLAVACLRKYLLDGPEQVDDQTDDIGKKED